jgi:hypothetical protein
MTDPYAAMDALVLRPWTSVTRACIGVIAGLQRFPFSAQRLGGATAFHTPVDRRPKVFAVTA